MKFCPQCKKEYQDIYSFCLQDGTKLEKVELPNYSDDEQETVIRTSNPLSADEIIKKQNESPVGDETAVMPPLTGDETIKQHPGTLPEQSGTPTDQWQEETPPPQWQPPSGQEQKAPEKDLAAVPAAQSETFRQTEQVQTEGSKSHLGLIIGGIAIFALLILGTAIGSAYLYYRSQTNGEIASANTNQENQSISDNSAGNSEIAFPNENAGENADNTNPEAVNSETKTDEEKAREDKKKDEKKDEKNPTPTVTPKNTPKDAKQTPTPKINSPTKDDDAPPPPNKPTPTKRNVPSRISGGVVNGKAISLPKPAYPSAARAANIKGSVNVVVVISRSGSVISASAVSGHPLLRSAAVAAARRARFAPTMLSGQPVEVSGVIVYNFN